MSKRFSIICQWTRAFSATASLALGTSALAVPINLQDNFYADPEVTFSNSGYSATIEESSFFSAILSNDPFFGDPQVIQPGNNVFLSFQYEFVEPAGNDNVFSAKLFDSDTGASLSGYEFATNHASGGLIEWDLTDLFNLNLGMQFDLSAAFTDFGYDAYAFIESLDISVRTLDVPEPGLFSLFVCIMAGLVVRRASLNH